LRTEHTPAGPARPATDERQTRASDADRDRAAGLLGTAFAEGRLTADEHGERLSAVYAARTWQQLRQLTADLPAPAGAIAARPAAPGMLAGADRCLLCALLIICPPAGIAWWLRSRRGPMTGPDRPLIPFSGPSRGQLPPWREAGHAQGR